MSGYGDTRNMMMLSKNMFLRGELSLILTRVTEADPPGAVRALGTLLLAAGLRVRGVRVAVPRQGEVQLVPGEGGQDGHSFSVPSVVYLVNTSRMTASLSPLRNPGGAPNPGNIAELN